MAEHAHQVPDKYGAVTKIFHPRINSYHRRLIAGVPAGVLALACIWFMVAKRPTPVFMVLLGLITLGALFAIYSTLRPQIVVKTETHVLSGRLFGWQAAELSSISQTVFAERLTPRQAAGKELTGMAALRYKGVPALWAVNAKGKRVFRLDGRIWDAKTLRSIATAIAPRTTVYQVINVTQMNRQHPGLVTFNELHPGWKSATAGLLSIVFILLLAFFTFMPDQTLQDLGIL